MNKLWQDLRYAGRTFLKTPGFTLIAVLSIALGIAANTSIFTLVNALLFKSMPVPHPEQLVALYTPSRIRYTQANSPIPTTATIETTTRSSATCSFTTVRRSA